MTLRKHPLDPRRLRSALPRGFGWIDHRFLTDGHLARCTPPALGLYCLLICAADRQGLSYYSEARLRDLLGLDAPTLLGARRELLNSGLVAYQKPLYQVLALSAGDDRPRRAARPAPAAAPQKPLPPASPPRPSPPPPPPPFPAGLNLRAMVEASLRQGGLR